MSLGIVSVGLLSVMGLMPVGLSTLRLATDQTVEAQIVQKLSGKILLTPFSKLPVSQLNGGYSGATFVYDQEGELLESNTSNGIYSVTTSSTNAVVYPGSIASGTGSLRLVQVDVKKIHGILAPNRFNVFVPNSGN